MSKSTVMFGCYCFATDANKLIDFWETAAFHLDGELTYRKSGFLRNKISFKMKFDSKNDLKFKQYYSTFKNRYEGAYC